MNKKGPASYILFLIVIAIYLLGILAIIVSLFVDKVPVWLGGSAFILFYLSPLLLLAAFITGIIYKTENPVQKKRNKIATWSSGILFLLLTTLFTIAMLTADGISVY